MVQALTSDVETRVQAALASSPIYALRDLHVERDGQIVTLFGRVDSFYYKQLAQEVVRSVCDGLHVVNSIDVDYPAAVAGGLRWDASSEK